MSKAAIILAAGPGAFFRKEKCDQSKRLARHD
jgi:choline kinase